MSVIPLGAVGATALQATAHGGHRWHGGHSALDAGEVREILDAPIEDPAVADAEPDETDVADDGGVANE